MKIPDNRMVWACMVPARTVETGIETGMKRTRRNPEQISRKLAHVAHVSAVAH